MRYEVVDKIFINEAGNQVNYKRLAIQGYLNGNLETIELPISKEQVVIYNAMSGDAPEVRTSRGGNVEVGHSSNDDKGWLDD